MQKYSFLRLQTRAPLYKILFRYSAGREWVPFTQTPLDLPHSPAKSHTQKIAAFRNQSANSSLIIQLGDRARLIVKWEKGVQRRAQKCENSAFSREFAKASSPVFTFDGWLLCDRTISLALSLAHSSCPLFMTHACTSCSRRTTILQPLTRLD
jgi:hypothetical protein